MEEFIDYIYVQNSDITDRFFTGSVSKSSIIFTKKYIFTVPISRLNALFNNLNYNEVIDAMAKVDIILRGINKYKTEDFENEMKIYLTNDNIFNVSKLEKFDIQVGFMEFGGMAVKKKNKLHIAINIQPKALRQKLKEFYNLSSKF